MRSALGCLAVLCLTTGCSLTPPTPPRCVGTFRPINVSVQQATLLPRSVAKRIDLCSKGSRHVEQG